MKKILTISLISGLLFASNSNDINKKIDLLINKINSLEKKVEENHKEIETLKKSLHKQKVITKKEFALKSCNNIKITKFDYTYNDGIIPSYSFKFTLKNDYPYEIKKVEGSVYFDDKDGTTIVKHYIERTLNLKPSKTITISAEHLINNELEKELKNENKNNLKVYFSPTKIIFTNNKRINCF